VKLFRRVEAAPNPDVEIGEQLTTRTTFRRAPRVAGFMEYEPAGEPVGHLLVAHEFIAGQADGWNHALSELDRFYEEVQHRGELPPELSSLPARGARGSDVVWRLSAVPAPAIIDDLTGAYVESAQLLGRRTAELHAALSSDTSSPVFSPEPFTREDVARVAADALSQVQRARDLMKSDAIGRVERLLHEIRDSHSARAINLTASRIRIHGDYHLGQVLWAESDFYLLDFEGEPARAIEERRRKESPMKDIAGMLRSYGYAAYAGLFARVGGRSSEWDRLEPWARTWQRWTSAAFLKGYLGVPAAAALLPVDPVQRASLLDLFLLDKALYELNYELNNRPDWVRIPLRGLEELLG